MRVLVLGASGLVGSRFVELYGNFFNLLTPDEKDLNILDNSLLEKYFESNDFDTVINFAAYTDVAQAEKQRNDKNAICWKVNVLGTENIQKMCESTNKFLIHISTDFVFSGNENDKGPYKESHLLEEDYEKLCWYGITKAESEKKINKDGVILRISYPYRSHYEFKIDFARTILKLFDDNKLFPYFSDQQITPSFIDEICLCLEKILNKKEPGIFHCASNNITTPYDFAEYLLKKTRNVENVVEKGNLTKFLESDASRPKKPIWGGLDTNETQRELGIKFMNWENAVDKYTEQISGN